jgi:two-component system LytT family response regulator
MRALVVDDEPAARRKVVRFLKDRGDIEIAGEAAGALEAIETIARERPDIVFLDIQMPDADGFEVVEALASAEHVPAIIFATAHDRYAVRAFEVSAIDYLLKPFDRERFDRAVERARKALQDTRGSTHSQVLTLLDAMRAEKQYARRLLVSADERAVFVSTRDIVKLEADRNNVVIYSRGGTYVLRSTLDALERKLDPAQFVRVHRSHIINIDAVKEIHGWFHGDYKIRLHDGSELMWSRRFAAKRPDLIP